MPQERLLFFPRVRTAEKMTGPSGMPRDQGRDQGTKKPPPITGTNGGGAEVYGSDSRIRREQVRGIEQDAYVSQGLIDPLL
jgi:hypothetical protein